jgi:hypothetical protein
VLSQELKILSADRLIVQAPDRENHEQFLFRELAEQLVGDRLFERKARSADDAGLLCGSQVDAT